MFSRPPVRLLLASSVLVALLHFGSPGGLGGLASDWSAYRADRATLAESAARESSIDGQLRRADLRMEHQYRLHAAMQAGEITFREACDEFRAFALPDANFERLLSATCPGETADERLATFLLTSLISRLEWPASDAHRVRFEEQYRDWFGHEPVIVLRPTPPERPVQPCSWPAIPHTASN